MRSRPLAATQNFIMRRDGHKDTSPGSEVSQQPLCLCGMAVSLGLARPLAVQLGVEHDAFDP